MNMWVLTRIYSEGESFSRNSFSSSDWSFVGVVLLKNSLMSFLRISGRWTFSIAVFALSIYACIFLLFVPTWAIKTASSPKM